MAIIDVSKYLELDKKYGDRMYRLWGPTLLCYPMDTNGSRAIMSTSFQKQILSLENPDVPYVLTGMENTFGKYNRAYKMLQGDWEILDKIDKFGDGQVYTLVLYNKETGTYDMLQKPTAEVKSEKFGFKYNTERMDTLSPGEHVQDEVLYKSMSYDSHMNYRLGKNALVMYSTSNPTIEDAIYVRKGWADSVRFFEFDNVWVGLNDNDIFTNRMGTDDEFIPFPSVGEHVKDAIICSTRRIVKDHILYDFQSRNLRETYATDTCYYTSEDAVVYDIDVYYNGEEEMKDNVFNRKLKWIYQCCCSYADRITAWGRRIKEICKTEHPKRDYTQRVSYLISRYQHVSDPTYKWKYKDREFSNILVNFKTCATVSLEAGFKLVGRYGDKGVISKLTNDDVAEDTGEVAYLNQVVSCFADSIGVKGEMSEEEMRDMAKQFAVVPDSEMPYMEDGTKVDVLLNASGAIRRLNAGQLDEVDLSFQMECIRKEICKTSDIEEKFNLLFRFLEIVNKDEYKFFYEKYANWSQRVTIEGKTILMLDQEARKEFIHDVEVNGIRLIKPPHSHIRYDTVKEVYHAFPFIQPVQLYIDKFGIARKPLMQRVIVGYKYMYALKQTSNKNFSARSMGRVNKKGVPEKSTDKRDNRSKISHNPLKIGEVHNLMSAISGRTLAEHNIFTRSSPVGGKSLKRILKAAGNPMQLHRLKIKDSYRNVNADILNAYLKAWGIRINFITDADLKENAFVDVAQMFTVHGYHIIDLPSRRPIYERLLDEYEEIFKSTIIVASNLNDFIWDTIFKKEGFDDTPEDIQNVCRLTTLGYYDEHRKMDDEDEE